MQYTIRRIYEFAEKLDALDIPCKIEVGFMESETVDHEEEPKVYQYKNGKRAFILFPEY